MKVQSSQYINEQRRNYSLYVMQNRAIPSVTDGLKAAGRRVLWTARDGKKYKSASLAGATMPIHPHASPEGAIDTLAAPYGNNIPLFKGDGAFGTLLNPTSYGASRYTSVTVSQFTKDVIFRDIEIIPMMENYDGTLMEPVHFLPLIPIVLLNPAEGIAVGFATNILPRSLEDIIIAQISWLRNSTPGTTALLPTFTPIHNRAVHVERTERSNAYFFEGKYTQRDATTIDITHLPYGQLHEKVIDKLDELKERGEVVDYEDASKDQIHISVKFKRGVLRDKTEQELLKSMGLISKHVENLNVLDFSGKAVWNTTPQELIDQFTQWRLGFYQKRYQRLFDELSGVLSRYYDIELAIKLKIGQYAIKCKDRAELKLMLNNLGINDVDYIADLPTYRFTEDEREKNLQRIKEAEAQLDQYRKLLDSEQERKTVFIHELEDILKSYHKGDYNHL